MRVLFLGDVVGDAGVAALRKNLVRLKRSERIDFCVVNGENSSPYNGVTPDSYHDIIASGADCVTTGNHVFKRSEVYDLLDSDEFLLRPANYHPQCPGHGSCVLRRGSLVLGVGNIAGAAFMDRVESPFDCAERMLREFDSQGVRCRLIDIHAEATGEKCAFAYFLDGRVSAVIGTHTHVQTADERVLPLGTAYMTDAGMCGPAESVLGVEPQAVINKLRYGMPVKFTPAPGRTKIEGCIIEIDKNDGCAVGIERVSISS